MEDSLYALSLAESYVVVLAYRNNKKSRKWRSCVFSPFFWLVLGYGLGSGLGPGSGLGLGLGVRLGIRPYLDLAGSAS